MMQPTQPTAPRAASAALSRRLAEAMGGTIGLATTWGQGNTFWVALPVEEGPVQRHERLHDRAAAPPAPAQAAGRRRTILHVEDNLSNLKLVERVLAQRPEVEVFAAMRSRTHRNLLVTGEAEESVRPVALAKGVEDLPPKPFQVDEVLMRVRLLPETHRPGERRRRLA